MTNCRIHLENYTGVYYNGSEIKGRLECYFEEATTVRGIKIRLQCRETCRYTNFESYTNPSNGVRETRRRYVRQKGYMGVMYKSEQMLSASEWTSQVFNEGHFVYPFCLTLSHNEPSTVNHTDGCIYYELIGIIDIPLGFDYEDTLILHVEPLIDFNQMPKELQEPVTYSTEKTMGCGCWSRGGITLDVELPKKAFVLGEVVDLKATICNMSSVNVDGLSVTLAKVTTINSNEDVEIIASLDGHGVGAHNEHSFDLQLTIPESLVVPNFSDHSICFKVRYVLEVFCQISSTILGLKVAVRDIIIGHIKWGEADNGQRNRISSGLAIVAMNDAPPPFDDVYSNSTAPVEHNSNSESLAH